MRGMVRHLTDSVPDHSALPAPTPKKRGANHIPQAGPALLLRHTRALSAQIVQTAACNCFHSIERQLRRWLLATLDRQPASAMVMTQELPASALGLRREGISEAAGKRQRAGLVSDRRGHIPALERPGLESRAWD